jgi:hypothetical protein
MGVNVCKLRPGVLRVMFRPESRSRNTSQEPTVVVSLTVLVFRDARERLRIDRGRRVPGLLENASTPFKKPQPKFANNILHQRRTHVRHSDVELLAFTNPIVMMVRTPEHQPDTNTSPEDSQGVQSPESQPSTEPSQNSRPLTQTTSGNPSTPNLSMTGSGSDFLTPELRTPVNSAEGVRSPPDLRPPASRIASHLSRELTYSDNGVIEQAKFAESRQLPGV